jgi:PDDEXK-like family of unknown function
MKLIPLQILQTLTNIFAFSHFSAVQSSKSTYEHLNSSKPTMKLFNADARARLNYPAEPHACSYSTSGSDHDSLSYLVHAFFENEYEIRKSTFPSTSGDDSDSDMESSSTDRAKQAAGEIRKLLKPRTKHDPFRLQLYSDVEDAMEALAPIKANRSGVNRAVMTRLREKGYDSGLCKARWDGSKGLAPGSYEYIDVMQMAVDGKKERYIVDVYFTAESEVAGPTDEYKTVLSALPEVALVRPEEVINENYIKYYLKFTVSYLSEYIVSSSTYIYN